MENLKSKAYLFFVFSLTLVLASSAWSVDFNCPGGAWYQVSYCGYGGGGFTATPPGYPCETTVCVAACASSGLLNYTEITGSTKKAYTYYKTTYVNVCQSCSHEVYYTPPFCSLPPIAEPVVNCTGNYTQWHEFFSMYATYSSSEYEWKCPCTGSETKTCYDGPAGTEGVGICHGGAQTCSNNWFGSCQNQVTPQTEICGDGIDNNCDGQVDEGCGIQLPETVYQCEDKFKTAPPYYDTTTKNICSKGCLLSSLTMVLDYYLNKKGLPMVDVESLNEWLKNNNGFKPDGRIDWSAIKQYPGADVFYDWKGSNTPSKEAIDKELTDGHPVILNVKDGNHFVIAIGKEGDTYKIIDPGHKPQATTLKERYNNKFDGIRIIRPK